MKSIILFFLIFFFQSIANANLLSDCQNITQKPLNELAELCPIGNNKAECNCEVQFSDDSDSLEAKIIKEPKKNPNIKGKIECDGKDKFCEFTDEEGNEICDGKLVETPGGIYVGEYDNKGRADGEGMFINEDVIYIGEFSKNRMHKEGILINKYQQIIAQGKHKYGRMYNYNVNLNNFDLSGIKQYINYQDFENKIRTTNIIKMNTGLDLKVEMFGNNPRGWYYFNIDPQKTNGGKYMCKFDENVIGQITGGGDGGTDGGGGGEC